jgi:teichuronic acid biosynthesis glycosyltransferase TuaG
MNELVSVIMPTYNTVAFLEKSINSVLSQTYPHIELLITDDHSSNPQTHKILQKYAESPKVDIIFLNENHGAAFARNESIRRARGRYIAFCDSDDVWFPDKIEKQLIYMQRTGCALCCSSYLLIDEHDNHCSIRIPPRRISFRMEEKDNKIGCSTAIYDTQAFGGKVMMPQLRKRQDWGFFLTLLRDCKCAFGIQRPLAYYRIRSDSVSSNKLKLIGYNLKVYTDVLNYSLGKALVYLLFLFLPTYLIKRIKRKKIKKKFLKSSVYSSHLSQSPCNINTSTTL